MCDFKAVSRVVGSSSYFLRMTNVDVIVHFQVRAETDKRRLKELENQLAVETERSYQLQQQLNNVIN
jgi:hypothetical protein